MRRGILVLVVALVVISAFNSFFMFNITGSSVNSEGSLSLYISNPNAACGDLICHTHESCETCAVDCGSCPVDPPVAAGGGGGGGGGGISSFVVKTFEVDQSVVKVLLGEGESFKKSIVLTNLQEYPLTFKFSLSESISSFVTLSDSNFVLQALGEKEVFLNFLDSAKKGPGVYVGNIIIEAGSYKQIVNVVNTIKSKNVLFDVSLDVPMKSRILTKGEDLEFQLTLFNIGDLGKTEVTVEYIIKDFDGNIIYEDSEVIEIEKQISYSKNVKLPNDLKFGEYILITNVRYGPSFGTSSYLFQYESEEFLNASYSEMISKYKYAILGGLILLIGAAYYLSKRAPRRKHHRARKKTKTKVVYRKAKPKREVKNFFGKTLALESAYKEGYITKKSYKKGKKKLSKAK